MVTIKNTGNSALEDDANNDTSLVASNGQFYRPDRRRGRRGASQLVTECTNFDGGSYRLDPGQTVTGCRVRRAPGVSPSKFKYAPASESAVISANG